METSSNYAEDERPTDISRLVRQSLQDWIDAGYGNECFWETWPECPTNIDLTPNMILTVLNSFSNCEREST